MKKFNVMKTIVMTMLFSAATMYGCTCRYETITLAGVNDEQHFSVSEFTNVSSSPTSARSFSSCAFSSSQETGDLYLSYKIGYNSEFIM